MSQIKVSYSPYRAEFRAQKIAQRSTAQAMVAPLDSNEIIKIDISPKLLIVSLFLISVVLGALYMMNFQRMATTGNQLKRLEMARQELKKESDLQNLYVAKARSLNEIKGNERLANMHKAGDAIFISGDNVLAKAN